MVEAHVLAGHFARVTAELLALIAKDVGPTEHINVRSNYIHSSWNINVTRA